MQVEYKLFDIDAVSLLIKWLEIPYSRNSFLNKCSN